MRKDIFIIVLFFLVVLFLIKTDCIAQVVEQDTTDIGIVGSIVKNDTLKIKAKSPTGAMIRSMLVPGLGQWYNNKKLKSLIVFCGQTGLLINAVYLNQKLVKSTEYLEREFYINNRNLSVWWLVGVTLFSMTDAFVDAHLTDFDESPNLSLLRIKPIVSQRDAGFKVSLCFNF